MIRSSSLLRVAQADALLSGLVAGRPASLAPEDLLNLHMTVPGVLDLCREPKVLELACRLLGTQDVSVFTTRILCKLPKTGKEIVWHQDSNYWPLVPPQTQPGSTASDEGGAMELNADKVAPEVASLWMALDDVTPENGAMEVLPYSAQPESKGRNVTEFLLDSGGATEFSNFNLSLDPTQLNLAGRRTVCVKRGEAEWHSAWTCHRSDPNTSERRRLAWIVRYCPTGTRVVSGIRGSFGSDYQLVPVCGRGALDAPPLAGVVDKYRPCFGNDEATAAALKR